MIRSSGRPPAAFPAFAKGHDGWKISSELKKFIQPEWLSLYAIGGYIGFLLFQTIPDVSTLLLFSFGLFAFLAKDGPRPALGRLDYLVLLIFAGACVLATLFSENPVQSVRYLVYLGMNVFLLLLAASLSNIRQVFILLGCLMLLGLIHLGAVLISGAGTGVATPEALVAQQPFVTLLVPNDALIIGLCLPASVIVFGQICRRWMTGVVVLTGCYLILAAYASYLLQSKVALIGLMAALLSLVAAWRGPLPPNGGAKRRPWIAYLVIPVMLLLIPVCWLLGNQSTTRIGLWSYAITNHSPAGVLVGSGPNTFNYDPAMIASPVENGARMIPWVHNLFLEAWTEQGLLGLVGILAVTIIPLVRSARMENRAMRAFIFASASTFCLLGLLELTLTRRFYFAYLALIYGLSCSPALRR
jgi:O-antigen ligase